MTIFAKLDINDSLFVELKRQEPEWWENLKSDEEIYIEIRKDNYINAYYKGGVILNKLKYFSSQNNFKAEIHYKYIPRITEKDYLSIKLEKDSLYLMDEIHLMKLEDFSHENLSKIKKEINLYANTEKKIQSDFILNDGYFIDSEFQYRPSDLEGGRIDLVRIDPSVKKIVFIELKTMSNYMLYTDDITNQIKKYNQFIRKYEGELLNYFKKVYKIKENLGILSQQLKNINIDELDVERKPLLLFGDCKQKWIDNNSGEIDNKIKDYAVGACYFGEPEYDCNLDNDRGNRHIF